MKLTDDQILAQTKFHMESVRANREKIKDMFIKTFMACLPDEELTLDLFNRVELVERIEGKLDLKIVWELQYKKPIKDNVAKLQRPSPSGNPNP